MAGEPEDKNALIERIGKIRGVIENDELDEAVSLLKVVTTDSRLEMHSADVLQVAARITELHKSRIGDVISRDDEVKESNRIRRSMISLRSHSTRPVFVQGKS